MATGCPFPRSTAIRTGFLSPFTQGVSPIHPEHPHPLPAPALLQQSGLFLQVSPDRHVTELHPEREHGDGHAPQTHPQHPIDRRQLAHPLGLIGWIHSHWIVPKCPPTMATPIAIHLNVAVAIISHRLAHLPPALKGFSLAVRTSLRTSFSFSLDIWQLQDDNRHGKLLFDGGVGTTILPGACSF